MKRSDENNDLFQSSHLILLISYTIFAAILIAESFLMDWEKWALILITVGVVLSWCMHFRQKIAAGLRIWIYAFFMTCTFFFYGIHLTSTYDLAVVAAAVIVLYTMTGEKKLITLCQVAYFGTMAYDVVQMVLQGETFDALVISRTLLHLCMIFMIGWFAKTIIDKWSQVLGKSKEEINQLTDATDRLNDFLANVSHELRTPVNAVIGLSTICIDKEEDEEIKRDMIAVRNAGRKVADQIGDILDYSEIDRDHLVRNEEDYMLSSVFHDLVTEIREYKSKEVELIIDVDPKIPSVMHGDVSKLKKILKALISNGLKYTHKGGVYVRIGAREMDYGVNLCIEVTDTGIGMSQEELERVYERFYQVDSGRSRLGGGLGLGMCITAGFVETLGGFMTIQSKVDVGTTVRVSIPQKVVDKASCMSVENPGKLCLGAFLQFDKFPVPAVREYYNSMVLNIVNGLGVQMHRVNNAKNLQKLRESIHMTHLFVGEEEYCSDIGLMEQLAQDVMVVVVANGDFVLPARSKAYVMEKPFYCFPVVSILNSARKEAEAGEGKMLCPGVKALVVDDEPMNLVVAKSIFKRYGMVVTTVSSGPEALEICREKTFDVIFMDHMMAGMDGVETMKRIRSDAAGRASNVPVVALTANAMSSARQMFLSEGFDGFVSKPIETEELERVLRQVLPKSAVTYVSVTDAANGGDEEGSDAENGVAAKDERGVFDRIDELGIDTEDGLKYCLGDEEFYKTLLLQYAGEAGEKISQIKRYYEEKDWENYEILVHALKSTSKMIGAKTLSDEAKQLEKAAKEKREDYLIEHHLSVVSEYDHLRRELPQILEAGDDVPGREDVFEFEPEDAGDTLEFEAEEEESES